MSHSVEYFQDGRRVVVSSDERSALLPVRLRGGEVRLYRWGGDGATDVVYDEQPGYFYKWPKGGHVPIDVVRKGDWWQLKLEPVKVAVAGFLIRHTKLGLSTDHWIKLAPRQYLQGALAKRHAESRVYLVTVDPPEAYAGITDPWPRIVSVRETMPSRELDESEREAKRRARRERG